MKKKLIIADDNNALLNSLRSFFEASDSFTVVGTASNGVEALNLVESHNPDFLLLDIVMPELDGFGVLTALTGKKPVVIMMSQLSTDGFVQKAFRYGASYFLAKPFDYSTLERALNEFVDSDEQNAANEQKATKFKSLDEKIANLFISVGIPAHIKGYQFLREAIKMTIGDPDMIGSITKKPYPTIADRYHTSASKVERAIRHAIEVAWSRGKIENINQVFGIKVYSPNEKPTNGEFIALIADKMILEGA